MLSDEIMYYFNIVLTLTIILGFGIFLLLKKEDKKKT